jgi:hypothetical protein
MSGTSQNLLDIAYGGGYFVAVGANGTVLYSSNGTVWQPSGAVSFTNINAIVYASSKFVLVTELGEVYTSNNGVTWSSQTSGVTDALYSIAYGNSKFVAGGANGTVITSTDAITWSNTTVGFYDILGLRYITNGSGNSFVATCKNNKVYVSTDGSTWTRSLVDGLVSVTNDGTNVFSLTSWGDVYKNASATTLSNIATVASGIENFKYIYHNGAGLFTVLTGGGAIYTSGTGTTWTLRTSGVSTALNSVYFDGTTWVIVGNSGVILTSTTGTTFTSQTSGTTQNLFGITKLSTTTWIAVGANGTILTSPNAVTWTARSSGTSAELRAVSVANLGGGTFKAIAVGTGGIGVSSADGTTWSSAIANSATDPSGATVSLSDLNSVNYYSFTPPAGSPTTYWIVTGDHGVVATSTNGTTWFTRATDTYANLTGTSYIGTYFYVSGDTSLSYLKSQDAVDWTYTSIYFGSSLLAPDLYDVADNNTVNVIGGQYGYFYYSTSQYNYFRRETQSVTYSNRGMNYIGSTYYAIGDNGHISTATDGQTWTTQSLSYGGTTTQRSIQKKLDDFVSVKDFGAKGDGVTDDTEAINRAMYELYCRTTSLAAHKVLWFPAGNYLVSGSINVPSTARLRGEGTYNTQITQTANPYIYPYVTWVMYCADDLQQIQNLIGLNGASLPTDITISDMTLQSLNDGIIIDSANRVTLNNIRFQGPNTATVTVLTDPINGSTTAGVKLLGRSLAYATDVNITDCLFDGFHTGIYLPASQYASNTLFDSNTFHNMYHGLYFVGTSAIGCTISNSTMDLVYNSGCYITNATNFLSLSNYYRDVGNHSSGVANPFNNIIYFDSTISGCASIGDSFDRTEAQASTSSGVPYVSEVEQAVEWVYSYGLRMGTVNYQRGRSLALANNTTAALVTGLNEFGENFGFEFQYTITRGSNVCTGLAKFTLTSGGLYSIEDDRTFSADVGVTFGYNGTDVTYTTDSTGTGLINYAIRYFDMF